MGKLKYRPWMKIDFPPPKDGKPTMRFVVDERIKAGTVVIVTKRATITMEDVIEVRGNLKT